MPLVNRTRATLRSAEFGFFGVWVKTRTQTPRFCGLTCSAGLFVLVTIFFRPWRTSWLIVGIRSDDPEIDEFTNLRIYELNVRLTDKFVNSSIRPFVNASIHWRTGGKAA